MSIRRGSIRSLLWQGKIDQHARPLSWRWPDITCSAHLCRAFAHREEPHAGVLLCWQPHSIVCDLELEAIKQRKTDHAGTCLCMANYIRQCLLHDPIGGYLHSSGQSGKVLHCLNVHAQACVGLPRCTIRFAVHAALQRVLLDRPDQAQLIERRWTQRIDEAADVSDGRPNLRLELD